MDGDQFRAVMESECPVIEEIEAIAEAKKQKSLEANKARADAEEKARREAQEKIRTAAQNNSDNLQDLKVEEPENKDQAENNQ